MTADRIIDPADLVKSAAELPRISQKAAEEFAAHREEMISKVNARMDQRADLRSMVPDQNIEMMHDNHGNHARFIESMLFHFNPAVLVETVCWVFRVYTSRGFHDTYWAAQLNHWLDVLKETLSPESHAQIYPLYDWLIVNIPLFSGLAREELQREP